MIDPISPLSDDVVREYQKLYKKWEGSEISDTDAKIQATLLVELVALVSDASKEHSLEEVAISVEALRAVPEAPKEVREQQALF